MSELTPEQVAKILKQMTEVPKQPILSLTEIAELLPDSPIGKYIAFIKGENK